MTFREKKKKKQVENQPIKKLFINATWSFCTLGWGPVTFWSVQRLPDSGQSSDVHVGWGCERPPHPTQPVLRAYL